MQARPALFNDSHLQPSLNSSKETMTGLHRSINIETIIMQNIDLEYLLTGLIIKQEILEIHNSYFYVLFPVWMVSLTLFLLPCRY